VNNALMNRWGVERYPATSPSALAIEPDGR